MAPARKPKARGDHGGVTFETVRTIAGELVGAAERTSYGTPAFFVGKTLFVRQHQDGQSLVVRIEPAERELRMITSPTKYAVTEHYQNYPLMLVDMASVEPEELRELLTDAWRLASAAGARRERKKRK